MNSTRRWILLGLSLIFFVGMFLPKISGQTNATDAIRVLYLIGNPNYDTDYHDQVSNALELDEKNIALIMADTSTGIDFSTQTDFDVIITNDYNFTAIEIAALTTWLQDAGHGLLIICGPSYNQSTLLLDAVGIAPGRYSFPQFDTEQMTYETKPSAITALSVVNPESNAAIVRSVAWNSAPELTAYTQLANIDTNTGNEEIISMNYDNGTASANSLVLTRSLVASGLSQNVMIFAGWISPTLNTEFQLWPYFNYFIFSAVQSIANHEYISYAQWSYSPVPHLKDQLLLGGFVIGVSVITILIFVRARKRGQPVRAKFERIEYIEKETKSTGQTLKEFLAKKSVLDPVEVQILEDIDKKQAQLAVVTQTPKEEKQKKWEEIGFHRQQAGFLQMLFTLIFLIIPQLVVTSFVMPQFIQPHPQAGGYYSFVLHFFEAIWLIFDAGTNFAITKFFATHRLERPEKAFHYIQIFIWWETLSGLAQIAIFTFLGSFIFPYTNYAYLTWIMIAHSLIQWPGFFKVFQFFFQGMQHTDKQMITYVLQMFLLRLVAQIVSVPLFRWLYSGNPIYGDAFGAGIGLIVGQYLGDIIMFALTIKWYNEFKIGYQPVFAAEFTMSELKETLRFGFKMAIGEVWVPLVWFLQVLMVSLYIPNYAAEQGYFELAWTISQISQAGTLIYEGTLGAFTEAHEYKKEKLLNYTTGASMRFGMFWTFFFCSALWAIGQMFIVGTAGEGWKRAADLMPLFVFFNIIGPFSWQADKEFAAANHPEYAGIAWIVEQGLRAFILIVFVPLFPVMETVIWAYIISLIIKDILVWLIIELKIHRHKWYLWQTFIAPTFAGVITYALLRWIVSIIPTNLISVLIIFVLTFFLFMFIYAFLYGFFGGYDKNTIQEFEKAAYMVTGVGIFARTLYRASKLGTKISPLHDRFKIDLYVEAYQEAAQLNAIKKKIG